MKSKRVCVSCRQVKPADQFQVGPTELVKFVRKCLDCRKIFGRLNEQSAEPTTHKPYNGPILAQYEEGPFTVKVLPPSAGWVL